MLESQPNTLFLGQLKTLLTGPNLHVASEVAIPSDIDYFIEYLGPKLPPDALEFLTALVAALNDRTKTADLDHVALWRNASVVSLETPWPDDTGEES